VRRAVDDDGSSGRFLLTGSATPNTAPTHSGADRIVSVRMRRLSLAERLDRPPTVSLTDLLSGRQSPLGGATAFTVSHDAEEIVLSGFPGMGGLTERASRAQLDGYVTRIVQREFVEYAGHAVRNEGALRRWLTAFAAATSTTASYETIRDAATAGDAHKPAKSTTIPYRSTLERLWIIDEVPAWLPSHNHLRRLATSPVHQLADPAIAARLLGVTASSLLENTPTAVPIPRDGTLLGALFESLVTLSVRVYAQAAEAMVGHLRTRGGEHEIDLIAERADGRVVAIEVKLSRTVDDNDVRHLRWLQRQLGPNVLDAIVVTTGTEAYRRRDGIGVVPAALLGPWGFGSRSSTPATPPSAAPLTKGNPGWPQRHGRPRNPSTVDAIHAGA